MLGKTVSPMLLLYEINFSLLCFKDDYVQYWYSRRSVGHDM